MSSKAWRSSVPRPTRSSSPKRLPMPPRRRSRLGAAPCSRRQAEPMSVLLNKDTKVLVQGITGKIGTFHAADMITHGTRVVGGVTPGKGGTSHLNLPVFDSVREAVEATGATASIVFVPPSGAADSIMEAADAGITFCV